MGLINFIELDFEQRFIFLEEKRKAAPNQNCLLLFGQLIFTGTISHVNNYELLTKREIKMARHCARSFIRSLFWLVSFLCFCFCF